MLAAMGWRFAVLFVVVVITHQYCTCSAFDADEVTRVIQSTMDCHYNPAMAVAVVKDGKVLYTKGFGHTDISQKTPTTDETLFGIASVSKSFAAALLVKQLYADTSLTLKSKVRELLGEDFVMPDQMRTLATTFEDLLSHRTAMLSNNRIRLDQNFTRETVLSRLRLLRTDKEFRIDFIYNNLIYGLVSRISEIIGAKKWEDLISEHFFQPLGMSKSSFATTLDFSRDDLAVGYTDYDGPDTYERVTPEVSRRWADLAASGAIMSSAKDMAKWLIFHTTKGKNERGDQVMKESLVDELHTARAVNNKRKYLHLKRPEFPISTTEHEYALGLRVGYYRGYDMLTHTGGTFGYSAYMSFLPTEKIGVMVMVTNRDNYFRHRASVMFYLMDKLLGLEPWLNSTTMCTYPRPWNNDKLNIFYRPNRTDATLKFPKTEYQGLYTNEAFGNLIVEYNSTLQSLVGFYGWGSWELRIWPDSSSSDERFFGRGLGPTFSPDMKPFYFITDPDEANTIVGVKAPAFDSKMPPIFCKQEQMNVCKEIVAKTYPLEKTTICSTGYNGAESKLFGRENIYISLLLTSFLLLLRVKC